MSGRSTKRAAFTLIELMVVITVIAVLIGLSVALVSSVISAQQTSNTDTTIRKVYSKLMPQWESVVKSARDENIENLANVYGWSANYIMLLAGNDVRRARVIYTKARLKQEFPMSYAEAMNAYASPSTSASSPLGPFPGKPAYYNAFNGKTGTGLTLALTAPLGAVTAATIGTAGSGYPASTTFSAAPQQTGGSGCVVSVTTNSSGVPTTVSVTSAGTGYSAATVPAVCAQESATCLLEAMKQGRRGNTFSPDTLGAASIKNFNGLDALFDAWGTPLQFVRWGTGNSELDGLAPPAQKLTTGGTAPPTAVRDPQDPDGLLLNNAWYLTPDVTAPYNSLPVLNGTLGKDFEYYFHPLHKASVTVTTSAGMYAFYTVPVLSSAGSDKTLGFGITDMTVSSTNAERDNAYSFRLLPPGARGD
jgi:prepilin-type N-terminal cleavage/methylation domain-containing protein